jgi:hypothetical protein
MEDLHSETGLWMVRKKLAGRSINMKEEFERTDIRSGWMLNGCIQTCFAFHLFAVFSHVPYTTA